MSGYCKYIINTSQRGMKTHRAVVVQALLIVNPTERRELNMYILINIFLFSIIYGSLIIGQLH